MDPRPWLLWLESMAVLGERIQVGETVVLQRYNYMRTHVLNPTKESIYTHLLLIWLGEKWTS